MLLKCEFCISKLKKPLSKESTTRSHKKSFRATRHLRQRAQPTSAANPTHLLGASLQIDQRLAFSPAREINELRTDGDALARSWQNRSEQSQRHAVQAQAHAFAAFLRSLFLCSRGEHYTPSRFSHATLFAAIGIAELFTQQWALVVSSKVAKKMSSPFPQESRAFQNPTAVSLGHFKNPEAYRLPHPPPSPSLQSLPLSLHRRYPS